MVPPRGEKRTKQRPGDAMASKARLPRGVVLAIPLCLALSAGGCSGDDIQFNGGLFDMVGLSDATKVKSSEPKVAERQPLVVPPSLDRLPAPGEPAQSQDAQLAAIQDPDVVKKASREELERKQAEYCKVNYEQAMGRGDETTALAAEGPLGPCRKSVMNSIKTWNSSDAE
jgi:hypothetical protein